MSRTIYRTLNGLPPFGGKAPAPVEIPNPNRRFITLDNRPPYGGVPPSQRPPKPASPPSYALATAYPLYSTSSLPSPPGSPPQYRREPSPPPAQKPAQTYSAPTLPSPPPRYEAPAPAPTPAPAPAPAQRFEPPGTKLYGLTPSFSPTANFSYIFPSTHICLQYWDDGTQPWLQNGSSLVSRRVVPACMSVRDLILQLGAPSSGRDYGITVCKLRVKGEGWGGQEREFGNVEEGIEALMGLGRGGGRSWWCWGRGETYRLGGGEDRTLGALGWKGVVGVAVWVG